MKLRNISIILLLILVVIGFSSCEEDRWSRGSLIYDSYGVKPPYQTDRYGTFEPIRINLDVRDIYGVGSGRISDIRMFDSFFLFNSRQFRPGDRVEVSLESSSGRRYIGKMYQDGYDFVVDISDGAYAAFVDDLMYDLMRYNGITLYVDATSNIRQSIDFSFEFNNNLDIRD